MLLMLLSINSDEQMAVVERKQQTSNLKFRGKLGVAAPTLKDSLTVLDLEQSYISHKERFTLLQEALFDGSYAQEKYVYHFVYGNLPQAVRHQRKLSHRWILRTTLALVHLSL